MTMNVSLTPRLESFVHEAVRTGRFQSASELVRTALRMLEDREAERFARIEWLRSEVKNGLDSGPALTLDMESIKRQGRVRLQQNDNSSV
jgi:antitoxin ParD1/3/4